MSKSPSCDYKNFGIDGNFHHAIHWIQNKRSELCLWEIREKVGEITDRLKRGNSLKCGIKERAPHSPYAE